jgi:hypothetical protein
MRCARCSVPARPDRTTCDSCGYAKSEYARVYRDRKLRRGLCGACPQPAEPEHTLCAKHLAAMRDARHKFWAARVCQCGHPRVRGHSGCARVGECSRAVKSAGCCQRCGRHYDWDERAPRGDVFCTGCKADYLLCVACRRSRSKRRGAYPPHELCWTCARRVSRNGMCPACEVSPLYKAGGAHCRKCGWRDG